MNASRPHQWLQLILGAIFDGQTIAPVWQYIHPSMRRWIVLNHRPGAKFDLQLSRLDAFDHPEWDAFNASVVGFFEANLDEYDHESWGVFEHPSDLGLFFEEYFVTSATGHVDAGTPMSGYRLTMRHDPDQAEQDNPEGWYLAGLKGELLEAEE